MKKKFILFQILVLIFTFVLIVPSGALSNERKPYFRTNPTECSVLLVGTFVVVGLLGFEFYSKFLAHHHQTTGAPEVRVPDDAILFNGFKFFVQDGLLFYQHACGHCGSPPVAMSGLSSTKRIFLKEEILYREDADGVISIVSLQ